jgi:hypothetical protein
MCPESPRRQKRAVHNIYLPPAQRQLSINGANVDRGCPVRRETRERIELQMQAKRAKLQAQLFDTITNGQSNSRNFDEPVFRIQLTDVHSIVHECIVCRVSIFYSKYK